MIQGSLRALAKSVHIRGPNSDLSGPTFRLQGQSKIGPESKIILDLVEVKDLKALEV